MPDENYAEFSCCRCMEESQGGDVGGDQDGEGREERENSCLFNDKDGGRRSSLHCGDFLEMLLKCSTFYWFSPEHFKRL